MSDDIQENKEYDWSQLYAERAKLFVELTNLRKGLAKNIEMLNCIDNQIKTGERTRIGGYMHTIAGIPNKDSNNSYIPPSDLPPVVVTMCGPRKFKYEMMEIKRELERVFAIIHTPNFSFEKDEFETFTPEMFDLLHEQHYAKMRESDFVLIVNVGEYIGKDTQREIDYAKDHNINVEYIINPPAPDKED